MTPTSISGAPAGMLAVFPFLAVAGAYVVMVWCLHGNGLVEKIHAGCGAPVEGASFPTRISYTSIPPLDFNLCVVVTFYHGLMNTTYRPLLILMSTTLAAIAIIPFAEATREYHPKRLKIPATIGVIYQICSSAAVMPIYWFAFALTGGTTRRSDRINQGNAEALLFALVVGYAIPTACMVVLEDPMVTAIWQFFPVYMAIAQWAHSKIRSPSHHTGSGYGTVQAMYFLVYVISAYLHVAHVWPLFNSPTLVQKLIMPPTSLLDPSNSISEGVAAFLKWDIVFTAGSTFLITLWFARSLTGLAVLILWHVSATFLVGPAAAIAGVMMWREATINAEAIVKEEKAR
ncbi:uncharacterized protein F5891DRAFT_1276229 [Suillus fuscotomentosus]|uniref:Uncharacterized protein n=1 Tax=Suillus fuscotomentosus TaxID=1912939 RepID=A0AAD4EDF8_9AGAM|nr:uncharacterized protein F5891DRAFT_1276229 [Suillus fuscotomentosus]KAG1904117.1 hypothetical protein F5891DRAFT_1276229 [Suillus fuscotomentosus]